MQINFSLDSVLYYVPLSIRQKDIALGIDAYTSLLVHMQSTVDRLNTRLLTLTKMEQVPLLREVKSAIMDMWDIIDTAHRMFLLLPIMGAKTSTRLEALSIQVKDLRDSFQHFNERIVNHFQDESVGDSVLGDFQWHYRESSEKDREVFICITGITRGNQVISNKLQDEIDKRFVNTVGLFGVQLSYVKREVVDKKLKTIDHPNSVIIIDDIVDYFNDNTAKLEGLYEARMEEVKRDNPGIEIPKSSQLYPMIVHFY
jgi:hypothetical protein